MIKLFKRLRELISSVSGQFSEFHLEMDKNKNGLSALVGGVVAVKEYGENFCELKTSVGILKIYGKSLNIAVYENKTVEISGIVEEVKIAYSKN